MSNLINMTAKGRIIKLLNLHTKYHSNKKRLLSQDSIHVCTEKVPVKEIKIPTGYGHIAAKLWGNDNQRPILALHGWQDNAGTWDTIAPMIASKIPVLAYDLPGHGLSSWIPSGIAYTEHTYKNSIGVIKDYFKWEKLSLMCHSMGAVLGVNYSCLFPELVDFCIALDCLFPEECSLNEYVECERNTFVKTQAFEALYDRDPPSHTLDEIYKKWHLGSGKSIALSNVKYLAPRGIKASSNNKYHFSRDLRISAKSRFEYQNKNYLEFLAKRLTCPTLFIKAQDSHFFTSTGYTVELRKQLEENNPDFNSRSVPGTHYVHLNNPERVLPHVMQFLEKYNFI